MSEQHNDGGPAFPGTLYISGRGNCQPVTFPDGTVEWQEMSSGMTLRDYFAGQALAGLLTQPAEDAFEANHFATAAYQMADAMLKERSRHE
jgi:hypothetical protein